MTEPADLGAETPRITLAGKAWPVPPMAWRDLKKCRRALLDLTERMNAAVGQSPEADLEALPDEDFDRLVMEPLLAGLQVAHPSVTREELEGWHITEAERQLAWLTVRVQSGLFVFRGVDNAAQIKQPAREEFAEVWDELAAEEEEQRRASEFSYLSDDGQFGVSFTLK